MPLDASHVLWIATTNVVDVLSKPIRSRFVELSIPAPTRDQVLKIVHSIYAGLRERKVWGHALHERLPDDVADVLVLEVQDGLLVSVEADASRYGAGLRFFFFPGLAIPNMN